ncbi:UNVERIFIED_CONTAM: hypothetical protein Sangu_2570400 [Sesamum angustifolium]|uniref:Reverse transcriptase Ty1/copia-type domain-containing protein n=1 Tax=Sesamum angustifolium TaxID=2727405 RepID=A0AAW2J757_9LAMI
MAKELDALENNDTWELTNLPPDKKAIGSKWVFKLKMNLNGSVERYKARLVAKGSIFDIDEVKAYLDRLFTIKDLGFAKYFHGLQLARSSDGLLITQTNYLTDILKDANLIDAKPFPPHFLQASSSLRMMVLSCILLNHIAVWLVACFTWASLALISHLLSKY